MGIQMPSFASPEAFVFRSLYHGRKVKEKLLEDPEFALAKAWDYMERWKARNRMQERLYIQAWEQLLDQGVEAIIQVLENDSDRGYDLRSTMPFPGIFTNPERHSMQREWKKMWLEDQEKRIEK